jgi:hypothetical protein
VSLVLYRYSSAIPLPSTSIQRMSQTHVFFLPSFLTSSRNKQDHCHEGMNCHHNEPQLVRCDKVHHHLVARRMARQSTSTSAPAARSMRGPFAEQQRSMASMTDLDTAEHPLLLRSTSVADLAFFRSLGTL